MPTISQLPAATTVDPADEIPLSQGGTTRAVSVNALLAGTQPAIMAPTGSLLGRVSLGAGGPEPITVGTGLALDASTVQANGEDHATFAQQTTLQPTDQAVLSSNGTPMLLPLSMLRGLFTAGANVTIGTTGVISATGSGSAAADGSAASIASLAQVSTLAGTDLVAVSQGGVDHAITYTNLLNAQTIDIAQPATTASDTDTFWVAQGSSTMLRQTLSAIWAWLQTKLPTYKRPVIEIIASTTLDGTVHNNRILVCSQPVTLTPAFINMGSGFACNVINLSGGNVTFGAGVTTSSGTATLASGQSAVLLGATYSGGNAIFATVSGGGSSTSLTLPGQPTALTIGSITSSSIAVSWTAPSAGGAVSSYLVQYRITGTTAWTALSTVTTTYTVVSGLAVSTSYDVIVQATNSAGTGVASSVATATTTAAAVQAPGHVTGLAAGTTTSSSVALTWTAPASGGAVASYTVQYRATGTSAWTTAGTATTAAYSVTGLAAATSYDFQVTAAGAGGYGAASSVVTAATTAAVNAVTSITWNVTPSGSYTHGSGAIALNAHVNPSTAAIQFGFSTSATAPPTSWTAATYVNADLWGAYLATPATAGTWYVWAEGTDGSALLVDTTPFTVT